MSLLPSITQRRLGGAGSVVVVPPAGGTLFSTLGAIAGDDLIVPSGVTLFMDTSTPALASLTVQAGGILRNYGNTSTTITAGSIVNEGSILFESDTSGPYLGNLDIVLNGAPWSGRIVGPNSSTTANDNNGSQRAFLMQPGSVTRLRANRPTVHRTKLSANTAAGATTLPLAAPVFWRAGDRIAIGPTDYVTGATDPGRTEIRTVAADTAGASSVTLTAGINFARYGRLQYATDTGLSNTAGAITKRPTSRTPTLLDQRASVMNLSSNIRIGAPNDTHWSTSRFGAHCMAMGITTEVFFDGVLFERVGQPSLGRYPMHWHMPSYNVTTGALLGTYAANKAVMQNCAIYDSSNRACSLHGVRGARLSNNTAVKVLGHVWFAGEDGSEEANVVDGNWAFHFNDPNYLGGSWRIKAHDSLAAGLWVTNGRNQITNNLCGDGPRGRWYAPAMQLGNQINGSDTAGFIDSSYVGGCFGLSKKVAIYPFYTTIENWDNNTSHSTWQGGAIAREIVADEAGNTRQGKIMSTSNNAPCDNYGSGTQIASHFLGERIWKALGGAGYKNQVAFPLYEEWVIADCPGEGFFGTTDRGDGEHLFVVGKSLNHGSLPAGVPDLFNAFATYHGTLRFRRFWAFNFIGTPVMYQGESVDLSLRCSAVFASEDLYLDPVERYFDGIGYAAYNSIMMYRSPPPTIYQPGYSVYTSAGVGRDTGGGNIQWAPYAKVGAIFDPTGDLAGDTSLAGQYVVFDHPYFTTGLTKTSHSPSFLKTASIATPFYGLRWYGTDMNRGSADSTHQTWQQVSRADNSAISGAVWDLPSAWNYGGVGGSNEYPHGYAPGTSGQDSSQPAVGHHHGVVGRGQRVLMTMPNATVNPFTSYVRLQISNVQRTVAGGASADDYVEFVIEWSGSVSPALYFGNNPNDPSGITPANFFYNMDTMNSAGHSTNAFSSLAAFNASEATGFWRDTANNKLTVRFNANSMWDYGEDVYYPRPIQLIIVPGTAVAPGASYYIDPATGNNSNPGTLGSPWQSLAKVNSLGFNALAPGDSVFLKAGNTYAATLRINSQGSSTKPITLGAYGTGARPIMSGFVTLTGWTSIGGGVWEAACNSGAELRMVTVNGVHTAPGRFPKAAASNGGWLTYSSHSGLTSITDSTFTHTQSWVGGEIVIRGTQYIIDRMPIATQSGGTFTFPAVTELRDGFGYFIQNHLATLSLSGTTIGEWYYNPTTQKIRMYFAGNDPTSYTVKASVINTIINFSNLTNYVIDGLAIEGAGLAALDLSTTTNMTVQNCAISMSGRDAIFGQTATGLTVQACTITDTASDAIGFNALTNGTIIGNSIYRTGMHAGAGQSGDGTYNAISLSASSHTRIAYNYIDRTGYIGISFMGDHFTVENNVVLNSCQVKDDGAGIYTYYNSTFTTPQNQYSYVRNNIVIGGPGNSYGTSNLAYFPAFGIYLDNASAFVFVEDNTVSGFANGGVFVNSSSRDNTVSGNTLYNNGTGIVVLSWYAPEVVRTTTVTENVIVSKAATLATSDAIIAKSSQPCIYIKSAAYNDWSLIGTWSGNWYASPNPNEAFDLYNAVGGNAAYSLAGWRALSGDTGSQMRGPISEWFFDYATFTPKTVTLSGSWADAAGTAYSGTVTIPPFSSIALVR